MSGPMPRQAKIKGFFQHLMLDAATAQKDQILRGGDPVRKIIIGKSDQAAGLCSTSTSVSEGSSAKAAFSSRSLSNSRSRLAATFLTLFMTDPVPAGIRRPTITFSLRPIKRSCLP